MSTYHSGFADARTLTAETRAAQEARLAGSAFRSFLPDVETDTDEYRFNTNTAAGIPSAQYRAFDTPAPFGSDVSTFSHSGSLPPVSQKHRISEKGARIQRGTAAMRTEALRLARLNGVAIASRSLVARAAALVDGKVTVTNENGLSFVVDFLRPAAHSVAAATLWTDPTADAIGDLVAWQAQFRKTNNVEAGAIVMSSTALAALTVNVAVIAAAYPNATSVPARIAPDAVRQVLASYGFTNIIVNDETVVYANGVEERLLPIGAVLLLPGGGGTVAGSVLGTTQWGIPTEAFNPVYGLGDGAPGVFGAVYFGHDPEGFSVLGSSVVLPVFSNAKASLKATVL